LGTSTSYLNTPQAGDDTYTSAVTGLTEDSLFITYLAVMANDLGGAAKTLYSLDNGTNAAGALSPTDLLTQDIGADGGLPVQDPVLGLGPDDLLFEVPFVRIVVLPDFGGSRQVRGGQQQREDWPGPP